MAKALSGVAVFGCVWARRRWRGTLWPALESWTQ